MDRYLITHIDLDGYGCLIMAQRYLGSDIHYKCVNYDELEDAIRDVPTDAELFITDLSISNNLAPLLNEFDNLTIVDHHLTSNWLNDEGNRARFNVVVSTERCATYLFYEYLSARFGFKDTMLDEWARLVDDYDRYVLQYPDSRRLNALFYISDRTRFVQEALYCYPRQMLARNKERVDNYLENQMKYILNTTYITLSDTPKVILAFAEKNKSAIGEYHIREKGCDLVYILDTHSMQLSIRSKDGDESINCSKIAKLFGGGGHFHASGASLDNFEDYFKSLCGKFPKSKELKKFTEKEE